MNLESEWERLTENFTRAFKSYAVCEGSTIEKTKPAFSTEREFSFTQNQERAGGRWWGEREGSRARGRNLSRGRGGTVESGRGIQVGGQEEVRVGEVEGALYPLGNIILKPN